MKMKKAIFALVAVAALALTSKAEFSWNWWCEKPDQDVRGCEMGIGCEAPAIKGAQISLVYGKTEEVKAGCQVAVLGVADAKEVYNGCQVGLVTFAEKASLQFGFLCFNKNGFLPVFPFFNFSKGCYKKVD